jgi:hypothetical protein
MKALTGAALGVGDAGCLESVRQEVGEELGDEELRGPLRPPQGVSRVSEHLVRQVAAHVSQLTDPATA